MKYPWYSIAMLALLMLGTTGCLRITNSRTQDGGLFRSSDAGETWTQSVRIQTGEKRPKNLSNVNITGVSFHPQRAEVLVITTDRNGIYRTQDGGDTWQPLGFTAGGFRSHVFDRATPATQFVGNGSAVLKTRDDGATWETVYTDPRGASMTALAIDPTNSATVFAATSAGGLLRSVNGGIDWRLVQSLSKEIRALLLNPAAPQHLFIVLSNQILRSQDGGSSVTTLTGLQTFEGASTVQQLVFVPTAPQTLYAATNYGLMTSADEGDTWRAVTTLVPFRTLPLQTVQVDPQNPTALFFTVGRLLHKSEDGGKTWRTIESVPTGRLITTLAAHPAVPGKLYLGTFKVR